MNEDEIRDMLGLPEGLEVPPMVEVDVVPVLCTERRPGHPDHDELLERDPVAVFTRAAGSPDRWVEELGRPRAGVGIVDDQPLAGGRDAWVARIATVGSIPERVSYEFVCPACGYDVTVVDDKLQAILTAHATLRAPLTLNRLAGLISK